MRCQKKKKLAGAQTKKSSKKNPRPHIATHNVERFSLHRLVKGGGKVPRFWVPIFRHHGTNTKTSEGNATLSVWGMQLSQNLALVGGGGKKHERSRVSHRNKKHFRFLLHNPLPLLRDAGMGGFEARIAGGEVHDGGGPTGRGLVAGGAAKAAGSRAQTFWLWWSGGRDPVC